VSELIFQSVSDGPLLGVNARFGAGAAAVLGTDAAALANLVALAAGARAPRRGAVLFDGAALHASPEHRRATAAVFADEPLPALRSVGDALGAIYRARADRRDPQASLRAAGLADWAARRPRDLDVAERRTLALLAALDHPQPRLLVLHEPLAASGRLGAGFVREGVARALDAGAVVVIATQSLDDARSFGGVPWLLEGGVLTNVSGASPAGAPGAWHTFYVETPEARRVAAALARDPAVLGVRWDERQAPETVLVFGGDAELVASAITRVLSEESLRARGLGLSPLPISALLTTRPFDAGGAAVPFGAPQATYVVQQPPASYGAPYQPGQYEASPPAPYGAASVVPSPQPPAPYPNPGGGTAPDTTAASPPNQSVSMPTSFADPTRRSGGDS
jgi:ABC-type thiamine transport system ATPase subunit